MRAACLFIAIAFACLISTAASHLHEASADDQDCSLCAAVAHGVADSAPAPVAPQVYFVVLHPLEQHPLAASLYAAAAPSPSICGPPSLV